MAALLRYTITEQQEEYYAKWSESAQVNTVALTDFCGTFFVLFFELLIYSIYFIFFCLQSRTF